MTLVLRVFFVYVFGVSRSAKKLHRVKNSQMLFMFSPFEGWFCALSQGWGAHFSTISMPCLSFQSGGRAGMRFPRWSGGHVRAYLIYLSILLSIYPYIYISIYVYLYVYLTISMNLYICS